MTSRLHHIPVEAEIHDQVALLARAFGMTTSQTIAHLLQRYAHAEPAVPARTEALVPVYAIYQRKRVEGQFDRRTGALSIPAGPGAGQYRSPSGAAHAVITALRPAVSPIRTGWHFWRLAENGAQLDVLRGGPVRTQVTPGPAAPPAGITTAAPLTR